MDSAACWMLTRGTSVDVDAGGASDDSDGIVGVDEADEVEPTLAGTRLWKVFLSRLSPPNAQCRSFLAKSSSELNSIVVTKSVNCSLVYQQFRLKQKKEQQNVNIEG